MKGIESKEISERCPGSRAAFKLRGGRRWFAPENSSCVPFRAMKHLLQFNILPVLHSCQETADAKASALNNPEKTPGQ